MEAVSAHVVCKPQIHMQHTHGNIQSMLDCWADQVVVELIQLSKKVSV